MLIDLANNVLQIIAYAFPIVKSLISIATATNPHSTM